MRGDRVGTKILNVQYIPNIHPDMAKALKLPDDVKSLGLVSSDCDDVSYAALDEATKHAEVKVVYADSMYAGADNATNPVTGEFIGVIGGPNPEEVRSGMNTIVDYMENEASFISANDDDSIVFFAHCISNSGSYLSEQAGIKEGDPIAYLIAPPILAVTAMDRALKATDVELKVFYEPPSPTNYAGGLLTGDQASCKEACNVFTDTIYEIINNNYDY